MNRVIKFRAWDEKKKAMLNGGDLEEAPGDELCSTLSYGQLVIASTLNGWIELLEIMQYTGLSDKSGIEIYEGDIIHANYNYIGYFAVEFEGGIFNISRYALKYCTVVGNIRENPELLKGENK